MSNPTKQDAEWPYIRLLKKKKNFFFFSKISSAKQAGMLNTKAALFGWWKYGWFLYFLCFAAFSWFSMRIINFYPQFKKSTVFRGGRYSLGIQTHCNLLLAYIFFLSLFFYPSCNSPALWPLLIGPETPTNTASIHLCLTRYSCSSLPHPIPVYSQLPGNLLTTLLHAKFNCFSGACPSVSPLPGTGYFSSVFEKHGSHLSLYQVDQGFGGRVCLVHWVLALSTVSPTYWIYKWNRCFCFSFFVFSGTGSLKFIFSFLLSYALPIY